MTVPRAEVARPTFFRRVFERCNLASEPNIDRLPSLRAG